MTCKTIQAISLTLFVLFLSAGTSLAQIAVRGQTVHTMAGPAIKDGVVLIKDGKIERVGPASQIQIPQGYKTITATVVTPGLIDGRSVVGLAGYLNQPHDQDQIERSASVQPELRGIDAYNAREELVEHLRSYGITTLHTGHAPGALISGQTIIVKTRGDNVEQAVVVPSAMIAVTLGNTGLAQGRAPGTRAKAVAMLRAELIKARDYATKRDSAPEDKKPARDLRLETLAQVIKKQTPLLVNTHRAHDILSALRIAKEFDIRIVLEGASEAYLVADQIKAAGVPVIVHPSMQRAGGEAENLSMETAASLRKAGIQLALQSGYESYVPKTRVVLFEAAIAAANGLTFEQALGLITIDAARLLGIANRVGSLETGKDGDVVLFGGDPFEYSSHVLGVIIDGQIVSETRR